MITVPLPRTSPPLAGEPHRPPAVATDCPRAYLGHEFVYLYVAARSHGLAVGINLNPDAACNFDCIYCDVDRRSSHAKAAFKAERMAEELRETLALIESGGLAGLPCYRSLPQELQALQFVAFSGDGEPTLCPEFVQAVEAVVHIRAQRRAPFFKIVLMTNGSLLDTSPVREGLSYFTLRDELWIKLDAGTQTWLDRVAGPGLSLEKILANIRLIGRERPVILQSLFPAIEGKEPPREEIARYVERLQELKAAGTQIQLVQIYSARRPAARPGCGHLSLRSLSDIARAVRANTGLAVEVF